MSPEEALYNMKEEVLNAVFTVKKRIENNIKEGKERVIMVVGVGNTCGVPNSNKLNEVIEKIKKASKEIKRWEDEEKAREEKGFWSFGM
jgi:3-deoxy-D-arabino-heptulosonate 7-phosphate (DAHP) synthase